MAKNGHKTGKMAKHQCCFGGSWYTMLDEDEMAKTLGVIYLIIESAIKHTTSHSSKEDIQIVHPI